MKKKIHLICNAHLDPVWLWEWQEGAAEAVSTFRTAVEICETNDTFVFNHNEVILYEWVRQYEPLLFERIKKLVKKGRWHIMGGWYLQPDCNMPSGESFVRQILTGHRFFKRHFGVFPSTAINFDSFGHSRGLVQILAKSGYTSYLFGRPEAQWMQLEDRPFIWVGFDGSQVIARRFNHFYRTSLGKARKEIEERIAQTNNEIEVILWGVGNHGGGPSRKDTVDVNHLIRQRHDIELLHSTPDAYFADISGSAASTLCRRENDLNPWAVGCYTSMIHLKQQYRLLENELYLTEKMVSCAASNRLMTYPQDQLQEAIKALLFVQFHDILTGTCIQAAEEASLRRIGYGLDILSQIKAQAFFCLAAGQKKAKSGQIPIMVYNPHPYKMEEIVECEFNLPDINMDGSFTDVKLFQNGKQVPVQVEKEASNLPADWRKRIVFKAFLKPGQMNRFDCTLHRLEKKPRIQKTSQNGVISFKNDRIKVDINAKTGLIDRYCVDGVDYFGKGAFCPVVLYDNDDPWASRETKFDKLLGKFKILSRKAGKKFSGIDDAAPESVRIIEDGDVRTVIETVFGFEESFICQYYKLPSQGSEIEIETRVFWNQKSELLKLQIPLAFEANRYLGQTAYGVQSLFTDGNESVSQKWVAAVDSADQKCVTIINNGIYGSNYSNKTLRLSLLRSPAYSGLPIYDKNNLPRDRFTPRIDQGERVFKFWINAGQASKRMTFISAEAQMKNEKPYVLSFFPNGDGQAPAPIVQLNNPAIEVSAVKKAEQNSDWIVRLFNTTDLKQSVRVNLPVFGIQCNQQFRPYEIKTLRANHKGLLRLVNLMESSDPEKLNGSKR